MGDRQTVDQSAPMGPITPTPGRANHQRRDCAHGEQQGRATSDVGKLDLECQQNSSSTSAAHGAAAGDLIMTVRPKASPQSLPVTMMVVLRRC